MLRRWRRFVAVGAALILGVGCRSLSDGSGWQSLPPAPPGAMNFSDYQPDHPYEPSGEGVAERSVFTAPGGPGYSVEVRDFLISPRNPEAPLLLAGAAAVFEVRQGSGEATVGEETIPLLPGTVFSVNAGESLHVTARGEPLALRTWIVSPGREP